MQSMIKSHDRSTSLDVEVLDLLPQFHGQPFNGSSSMAP